VTTSPRDRRAAAPLLERSRDERGGIVTGWLLRLVLIVVALAFVVFEGAAVAINTIAVEDAAREVARAAAVAYRGGTFADADAAAEQAAVERGVELVDLIADRQEVTVWVRAEAGTLLVHELGPLARFTVRDATRTVEW
jgi:hypothetical protein